MQVNQVREKVIDVLYQNKEKYYSQTKLSLKLNLNETTEIKLLRKAISNLQKHELVKTEKGKVKSNDSFFIGYLQEFEKEEFYVYFNNQKYLVVSKGDMCIVHGDKVLFEIVDKHLLTVKIISVIKRKKIKFSGTYVEYNGVGFVVADHKKISTDVYVSESKVDVKPYEKVVMFIDEYKVLGKPEGVIERKIIEDVNKETSYLDQIIEKYNIQVEFPNEVLRKANSLSSKITKNMIEERVDLRKENIFTIDGKHAKDLDDAISVKKVQNGYELGVYIADVSYYVKENDVIDKNAQKRGTSHYLEDYVIPMLPQALSNGLCSLNEGEDKLCVGVKMLIDHKGNLLDREFFECVINSKKRFTYEEINEYLENNNHDFQIENEHLMEDLNHALKLASILRESRMKRGCIDFEFDEAEFVKYDDEIIGIRSQYRGLANRMVEEFMLMANQTVAQLFHELNHPFVYRCHENPFKEKIENFIEICKENGIDCSMINTDNIESIQLQELVNTLGDNEDLKKCINLNLITTMKQAKYINECKGHFGLSTDFYCHFTSPIRRYPDLFIHRLVKKYIKKTLNNDITRVLYADLSEIVSKHCCYTERNAARAEEEYKNLLIMNYMMERHEHVYKALIYSINDTGFNVLVDDVITGFIKVKFDDRTNSQFVVNGLSYGIGDKIDVYFKEYEVKNGKLLFEIGVCEDD